VLGEVETMGIKLNLKDISIDSVAVDELIKRGGKRQVPYLVDEDRNVEMYESLDIIAYLQEHYKDMVMPTTFNGLKIHDTDETCETCQ